MNNLLLFCFVFLLCSCKDANHHKKNEVKTYPLRLKPGDDLKQSLDAFARQQNIDAGWIVTCAGSLTRYAIRFANMREPHTDTGHFEIVSLGGTFSDNSSHLHISISDSTGKTIGGHLMEGCIIYTTAEIIIQSSDDYFFHREQDGTTPWKELQIQKK